MNRVTKPIISIGLVLSFLASLRVSADPTWQTVLSGMPLGTNAFPLNLPGTAGLMLKSFQSNSVVKALVFLPAATDNLYFYKREPVRLTNSTPSLFDALVTLTNQTPIRITFRPPCLLLHVSSDRLEPEVRILHPATGETLRTSRKMPRALQLDRSWDQLLPGLISTFSVQFKPQIKSVGSLHFYRVWFAAWNLNAYEMLEVLCLATRTTASIQKQKVVFEVDQRPIPVTER
jgi:hypothetical protein